MITVTVISLLLSRTLLRFPRGTYKVLQQKELTQHQITYKWNSIDQVDM